MTRNFRELLEGRWSKRCFVCVGLDSDRSKIPDRFLNDGELGKQLAFNKWIIDQTHEVACAFKPNSAFYEAEGDEGARVLQRTIEYANRVAPDVPVILDAKRGDIDNTNGGYVGMAFDWNKADAITVNPYMGLESLELFLKRPGKGCIALCLTSNKGAARFQKLPVDGTPLYQIVARDIATEWGANKNCGLVVGANHATELAKIREIAGDDMLILIPGVGAQGGKVEDVVPVGKNSRGTGFIVNSSRGIIFEKDPRKEAFALNEDIVRYV